VKPFTIVFIWIQIANVHVGPHAHWTFRLHGDDVKSLLCKGAILLKLSFKYVQQNVTGRDTALWARMRLILGCSISTTGISLLTIYWTTTHYASPPPRHRSHLGSLSQQLVTSWSRTHHSSARPFSGKHGLLMRDFNASKVTWCALSVVPNLQRSFSTVLLWLSAESI
jgi:hypothetical protein